MQRDAVPQAELNKLADLAVPAWQLALQRYLPTLITLVLVFGVARALVEPFFSSTPWMTYEEDDFFYYLKVAQNLAHGHGSTFNGIVPTNGYHPLWTLLLTAFSFIFPAAPDAFAPRMVIAFLAATSFAATMATYLLSRALITDNRDQTGAGAITTSALAAFIAIYSYHLFSGGMEILLTIPLALGVLVVAQKTSFWARGLWPAAILGLLVSAMALSRLDSLILAALLFAALLLHPKTRPLLTPRVMAGLAIGLVPLALYFLSNQVFFHIWMPISGMAKQLKPHSSLSAVPFTSLFAKRPSALATMSLVPLSALLLPAVWRRLSAIQQAVYPVVLVFPFIYLAVLSAMSDWKLWDWYFYSFRVALPVAFAVFCAWTPATHVIRHPLASALAAAAVTIFIFRTHSTTGAQYQLLDVAQDVRDFARIHPGVYAMGDRSGMVGYLLPQPLVQTEGLMMDRDFLTNIEHRTPLREALAKYNVRYYIATTYPPYSTGCIHVAEPWQAGTASPHMTAEFCEPPVAVFEQSNVRTSIYDLQR